MQKASPGRGWRGEAATDKGKALGIALILLVTGYIFIEYNSWLGYTDSSILYLAAVIGAGCYWIGSNRNQ